MWPWASGLDNASLAYTAPTLADLPEPRLVLLIQEYAVRAAAFIEVLGVRTAELLYSALSMAPGV
jgi:hypothetical protein